jgi:uncharacterized repeat protein (TIGR01451 family)
MKTITSIFFFLLPLFLVAQPNFINKALTIPVTDATLSNIVFADIDLDGDEDLIGESYIDHQLLVYLNQNGIIDTFPQELDIYAEDFVVVDWNNDNLPDLFAPNINSSALRIYLNQGGLQFSEAMELSTMGGSDDYYFLDVNEDGFIDLINTDTGNIYENNSGMSGTTFHPGINRKGHYIDLNADGLYDYVSMSTASPFDLYIYQAIAPYQLVPLDTLYDFSNSDPLLGACNDQMSAQDLDGDGVNELIIKACWKLHVLKVTGDFSYDMLLVGNHFVPNSFDFGSLAFADIDQNGFVDISVSYGIYFNDDFSFTRRVLPGSSTHNYGKLAIADTDNDGVVEIWESFERHNMDRFLYTSGTSVSGRELMWEMYPMLSNTRMQDFNNDGAIDIAYTSAREIVLLLNDGDTYHQHIAYSNGFASNGLYNLLAVNFDNDNWIDIVAEDFTNNTIRWFRNKQDGSFESMGSIYGLPQNDIFEIIGTRDLNDDNLVDFIAERQASFNTRVFYLMNTGSGLINQQEVISTSTGTSGNFTVDFHDVNGDTLPDMVFAFTGDNGARTINVYENNNGDSFNNIFSHNMTNNGRWAGLADVTQDGILDICYGKFSGGTNEMIIIPNNGDGTFDTPQAQAFDENSLGGVILDINNDDLGDIVNPQYVAYNDGLSFSNVISNSEPITVNSNTQYIDYDQDGDIDLYPGINVWENIIIGDSRIKGHVFYDSNSNGIKDAGETSISSLKIGVEGFLSSVYSDDQGQFDFPLGNNLGTFDVFSRSYYNDLFEFTSSPYPAIATLTDNNPVDSVSIGLQVVEDSLNLYQIISGNRCDDSGRIWLKYLSLRSGQSQGTIEVNLPPGVSFNNNASIPVSEINGNTLRWNLTDINVIADDQIWIDINYPSFQSAGDLLTFKSEMSTWLGSDTISVSDIDIIELTCAYDPNDKSITNTDFFVQGDAYYTVQDEVEYLIRFQNTGTAPANDVIVRDNLTSDFDISSLQFISSSHPASISINEQGLFEAYFENINLPDSTSDFTGSMGYVAFKIDLRAGTEYEKDIRNGARIYFDQNPPVFTNITSFQRVDCPHFLQVEIQEEILCSNDENNASVYDYGVPQNYEWQFEGQMVSNADTAIFFVPENGNFSLQLSTSNRICEADTLLSLMIEQSTPETLGLNFMDTTVCAGVDFLELEADVICDWTYNGLPYAPPSTSYILWNPGVYTLQNFLGDCKLTEEVTIDYVEFSDLTEDYFISIPNNGFNFCHGDTMQFSTNMPPPFYWTYEPTEDQAYFGNPVMIPSDPLSTITETLVYFQKDTLNCTITISADINFIEGLSFNNDSTVPYILCSGVTEEVLANVQTTPANIDSLIVYYEGVQVDVFQSDMPEVLLINEEGNYDIYGYFACHESLLSIEVVNFEDLIPDLLISSDSLYTSNRAAVDWYYTEDSETDFSLITTESSIIGPEQGFYYFEYNVNECTYLSDTIFLDIVGTEIVSLSNFSLSYHPSHHIIYANGDVPENGTIGIYDVLGRLIYKNELQAVNYLQPFSAGVYFVVATTKGRLLHTLPIRVID